MPDLRHMAHQIVQQFDLSSTTGRISVLNFHSAVQTRIGISTNRAVINQAICDIPEANGGTNIEGGLAQAQVELAGAHSGARKIVFLMSDGVNSNGDAAAINQATVLKNAGFELYVAGFGGARQVP